MTHQNYAKSFRDARRDMGFTHTSAYVPNNRLTEFSLYVDRLKAERMAEICEKFPPISRERMALARRNTVELPSIEEVKAVPTRYPNQPAINRTVSALIEKLEAANATMNVARSTEDEEDMLKWMSWAVAHNHMASIMWRELMHTIQHLEARRG